MNEQAKTRLDHLLTLRGLAATRSRARDLIKRGVVTVGGAVETRPGIGLPPDAEIAVNEDWSGYVSRGALKLEAALDRFGFGCAGLSPTASPGSGLTGCYSGECRTRASTPSGK